MGELSLPLKHAQQKQQAPHLLSLSQHLACKRLPHLTFSLSSTLHKIPFFPRLILVLPLNRRLACRTQQSRLSSFPFPPSRKNQATARQSFPLTHHATLFSIPGKPLASAPPPNKRLSSVSFPFKHHLSQSSPPSNKRNSKSSPPQSSPPQSSPPQSISPQSISPPKAAPMNRTKTHTPCPLVKKHWRSSTYPSIYPRSAMRSFFSCCYCTTEKSWWQYSSAKFFAIDSATSCDMKRTALCFCGSSLIKFLVFPA